MAANHPVSPSSEDKSSDSICNTLSDWPFLSNRAWPSLLVARQLSAKHAFLLAPGSEQHSILANREIWIKERIVECNNWKGVITIFNLNYSIT